jgi:hypothetical protein
MTMSWATQRVCACTKTYAARMSTFSTMSMNPIVGVLQSLPVTKSISGIREKSPRLLYRRLKRPPSQGRLAHKGNKSQGLELE